MNDTVSALEQCIIDNLQQMDYLYAKYARAQGMSYMSLAVLECICAADGTCTQKAICERTFYPKQSVNAIVKKLLDAGYVELRETPADRRNKIVALTAAGRAHAERTIARLWTAEEEAMRVFSDDEAQTFMELLTRFTAACTESVEALTDEQAAGPGGTSE